jgi:hypothetical protein
VSVRLAGHVLSGACMAAPVKRAPALAGAALMALGFAACGSTVSTAGFKGEEREVAQAISNLQTDATAGDQQKICANDLASKVVARLAGATQVSGGKASAAVLAACKQAIKSQLTEVDRFDVTVQSVQMSSAAGQRTASARVKSTYGGKSRPGTVLLVKEGATWKIAGLQ